MQQSWGFEGAPGLASAGGAWAWGMAEFARRHLCDRLHRTSGWGGRGRTWYGAEWCG
jgi:hypothetical protein